MSAGVVSAEQLPAAGPAEYYVVRYQVGAKPAIAKLAVLQQRLYCLRVRAAKPATFYTRRRARCGTLHEAPRNLPVGGRWRGRCGLHLGLVSGGAHGRRPAASPRDGAATGAQDAGEARAGQAAEPERAKLDRLSERAKRGLKHM